MRMPEGLLIRLRPRLRQEAGFTLVEVMITTMLMGLVAAVFLGVLDSVQRNALREDYLSRANDQARLGIEALDREIRSGNVLYNPAQENPTYSTLPNTFTLRIYTQTNTPTRLTILPGQPTTGYMCVLWTINSNNELVNRMWPPNEPDRATPWRVIATGIVNRVVSTPEAAFTLHPDPYGIYGGRTVDILLLVNQDLNSKPAQTVRIETSSTGRNTSYGFPQDVCADTPP